jgi:hypothetical protein
VNWKWRIFGGNILEKNGLQKKWFARKWLALDGPWKVSELFIEPTTTFE